MGDSENSRLIYDHVGDHETSSDDDHEGCFPDHPWRNISLAKLANDPDHHAKHLGLSQASLKSLKDLMKSTQDQLSEGDDKTKGQWNLRLQVLKPIEDAWEEITPQKFVTMLTVLGARDVKKFLDLLTIEITCEDFPTWKWLGENKKEKSGQRKFVLGTFPILGQLDPQPGDTNLWPSPWKDTNTSFGRKILDRLQGVRKVEYTIHWTKAMQLINFKSVTDQIYVMRALSQVGAESDCFNTVIGTTLLHRAWQSLFCRYCWCMILHMAYLFHLATLTACYRGGVFGMHWEPVEPPYWLLVATALWTFKNLLMPIVEIIGMIANFGPGKGFWNVMLVWCTPWNITFFIIEVLSATVMVFIIYGTAYRDDGLHSCTVNDPNCFLVNHSIMFSLIVLAKWTEVIIGLLCTDGFGYNVLPAFVAMTRKESVTYIIFLMLCVLASFHSYWSLPVTENMPGDGTGNSKYYALTTFMKIFRLDLLGDFDLWELEGVDPVYTGTVNATGDVALTSDDGDATYMHKGIALLFSMFSTVITVVAMNVGIGLVSSLYDDAKTKAHQLHCHFKCGYVFKLLLHEYVLRCGCVWNIDPDPDTPLPGQGYWIAYDANVFMDDADEEMAHDKAVKKLDKHMALQDGKLQTLVNGIGR